MAGDRTEHYTARGCRGNRSSSSPCTQKTPTDWVRRLVADRLHIALCDTGTLAMASNVCITVLSCNLVHMLFLPALPKKRMLQTNCRCEAAALLHGLAMVVADSYWCQLVCELQQYLCAEPSPRRTNGRIYRYANATRTPAGTATNIMRPVDSDLSMIAEYVIADPAPYQVQDGYRHCSVTTCWSVTKREWVINCAMRWICVPLP